MDGGCASGDSVRPAGGKTDEIMRMRLPFFALIGVGMFLVAGCATVPTGPSVMVLPSPGKPFEQFQAEDAACREWAAQQFSAQPGTPLTQNTAIGAGIGTLVGAGLGAALGAAAGNAGAGAAIGAGSGLLIGGASGSNADVASGWEAQRRYDIAFQQCMYAKGNQVPGAVEQQRAPRTRRLPPPPPPPPGYTPPPANMPPPPPPR